MENKYIEVEYKECCEGCVETIKKGLNEIKTCYGCKLEMIISYNSNGTRFDKYYHNRVCMLKGNILDWENEKKNNLENKMYSEYGKEHYNSILDRKIKENKQELEKWEKVLGEK